MWEPWRQGYPLTLDIPVYFPPQVPASLPDSARPRPLPGAPPLSALPPLLPAETPVLLRAQPERRLQFHLSIQRQQRRLPSTVTDHGEGLAEGHTHFPRQHVPRSGQDVQAPPQVHGAGGTQRPRGPSGFQLCTAASFTWKTELLHSRLLSLPPSAHWL